LEEKEPDGASWDCETNQIIKSKTIMKRNLVAGALVLLAGSLVAADSNPKEEVQAAAKKLADKGSYSWKTTVNMGGGGGGGGGGRFRPGPVEGKTEKEGATLLKMSGQDNTIEAVLKGTKGAVKADAGWMSLTDAAEEQGPARFAAFMLRSFKTPAAQAGEVAGQTKELKMADGAYSGDLTEEGAKQLLRFRGRQGGGNGPEISGAKGSVKFWVKDGVLTKYEYNVQGTVSFNGNDREVNRTTTTEITDVDSTKVTVPEEAAKKLSD